VRAPGQVSTILNRVVIISALGYFVDIYDLLLFSIVRRASLVDLGVTPERLLADGIFLLNWQMGGLLVGGVLWGILGDKRGRVSVLFGSILLYSLANVANAFVASFATFGSWGVIENYAALRFLAGVGLAGELGAAITLVTEVMTKETRGYGAAVVAGVGILGAVAAAIVANLTHWTTAYLIGGVLGLFLLLARFSLVDSGLFRRAAGANVRRGDLWLLVSDPRRLGRYALSLLVGLPIWFVVGILITFSPELSVPLGVQGQVEAGYAVLWCYVGLTIGDFASGWLSGFLRSRRLVFVSALALLSGLVYTYVFARGLSVDAFYGLSFALGVAAGYWAVFITNAAEQFGTNLRATVATTAPNFVRGAVVPITLAFGWVAGLYQAAGRGGLLPAAMIVGQACILIALFAVWRLPETYGKDLDYVEGAPAPVPAAVEASAPAP
jgi:MFS transporter, putative metabolite:H+ symporter